MSTTSDKYKTNYYFKKENEKNPIVFIHGVGLTNQMWEPQINFFKNHNVITYDLLGHGKTPLQKKQLGFDDFVKGVFPCPKISYAKTVLLNELI